jgi:hypothetical protein
MILSHNHKFIFVRPMKVAGTSVEMVLSTICADKDIVSPLVPVDERERQRMGGFCGNYSQNREAEKLYNQLVQTDDAALLGKLTPPPAIYTNHMSVFEITEKAAVRFTDFRLVTIERNPYAKLISLLHMADHFSGYLQGQDMPDQASQLEAAFDRAIADKRLRSLRSLALYGDTKPEVFRYEHIAEDVAEFGRSLDVELPTLPHAKRGALSNSIDPLEVFRRDQLDWFNSYCAAEFAAFGYEML